MSTPTDGAMTSKKPVEIGVAAVQDEVPDPLAD
jgi:hypothetical protein